MVDFAKEFYQQGSDKFRDVGGRIEIDGKQYTHSEKSGLQGGFNTKPKKLDDALINYVRKGPAEMFTRINSLDDNSAKMRDLASQMAAQIRKATGPENGWMDSADLLSKSDELLKKWKKDVEGLSSTK